MATRRSFLTHAGLAAPAVGALGVAAMADTPFDHTRRAIGHDGERPFSQAVAFGPLAFVSGVVGRKPGSTEIAEDFEAQCTQSLENLKAGVEAAGSKMANVLKCTCFLTDYGDFATFNKVFRKYFPSQPPARSTVVAKELVVLGAKIEIDCVTVIT